MEGARERQRAIFSTLPRNAQTYAETVRAAWDAMSAPRHEPVFRLFFEVYGLALQDPKRFPDFLKRAVEDWLDYLEPSALRDGIAARCARDRDRAPRRYRGFLLDLCATRDRKRISRAVEPWIAALDGIPSTKELSDDRRA